MDEPALQHPCFSRRGETSSHVTAKQQIEGCQWDGNVVSARTGREATMHRQRFHIRLRWHFKSTCAILDFSHLHVCWSTWKRSMTTMSHRFDSVASRPSVWKLHLLFDVDFTVAYWSVCKDFCLFWTFLILKKWYICKQLCNEALKKKITGQQISAHRIWSQMLIKKKKVLFS